MTSHPLTVLLVEDHALNMALATELLEAREIRVLQAEEAEEGLKLAREKRPDLILMDIQLPGMDGLTAIGHLRKAPETREIPVVVLSAHAMEEDAEKAQEAGAVGYIAKPIETRSFVDTVLEYLDGEGEASRPSSTP